MSCPDCDNAKLHPLSGRFTYGCNGCASRQLARMPAFHEAAKSGRLTPNYRLALQQFLPKLPVHEAHALVKGWVRP